MCFTCPRTLRGAGCACCVCPRSSCVNIGWHCGTCCSVSAMRNPACAVKSWLSCPPDIRPPTGCNRPRISAKQHICNSTNLAQGAGRAEMQSVKKYAACSRNEQGHGGVLAMLRITRAPHTWRRQSPPSSRYAGLRVLYRPLQQQGTKSGAHRAVLAPRIRHSTGTHCELQVAEAGPRP